MRVGCAASLYSSQHFTFFDGRGFGNSFFIRTLFLVERSGIVGCRGGRGRDNVNVSSEKRPCASIVPHYKIFVLATEFLHYCCDGKHNGPNSMKCWQTFIKSFRFLPSGIVRPYAIASETAITYYIVYRYFKRIYIILQLQIREVRIYTLAIAISGCHAN